MMFNVGDRVRLKAAEIKGDNYFKIRSMPEVVQRASSRAKERKMAWSEKAIETLREYIKTHAVVNCREFYAGTKVPTQSEALAALDALKDIAGETP
jgi:hypothetical protein